LADKSLNYTAGALQIFSSFLTNGSALTTINMAIFRQYIAPFLILLVFLVALLAVSARIFLPSDMAAPAPIEDVESASTQVPDTTAQSQTLEAPILPTSAGSLN
jgi:hypothetical protein